jgi:AbrB family looped-hinge helix DNA binding protein
MECTVLSHVGQEHGMATTKVTRKGQITIPIEIRKELDIREGDHLLVRKVDDKIILENNRDWATRTAGIFKEYARNVPHLEPGEERRWFEEAVADEVIRSMDNEARG